MSPFLLHHFDVIAQSASNHNTQDQQQVAPSTPVTSVVIAGLGTRDQPLMLSFDSDGRYRIIVNGAYALCIFIVILIIIGRHYDFELLEHFDFFATGFTLSGIVHDEVIPVTLPHRWFHGSLGLSNCFVFVFVVDFVVVPIVDTTHSIANNTRSHIRLTLHPENKFSFVAKLQSEWIVVEIGADGSMVCLRCHVHMHAVIYSYKCHLCCYMHARMHVDIYV